MHAFGGSAETALALSRLAEAAEARVYFGFSERAARLKRAPAAIQAVPAPSTAQRTATSSRLTMGVAPISSS